MTYSDAIRQEWLSYVARHGMAKPERMSMATYKRVLRVLKCHMRANSFESRLRHG